ncbi:MAG: SulP family inorganic anion transporter [Methanomicrobiales archaeon]|nr:SulP family inorganic anion transporter [Methanomicrobiales archaeon]MDD1646658.1 SulP family inorganic anion transporter [Methanomicrobiales archaeon]
MQEPQGRVRKYVPIRNWLPSYKRDNLVPDLIAGVTVWGVLVPASMAYAEIAGIPPQAGLAASTIALAAYAILGTSRNLRVAMTSTMAITSAAIVAPLALGDEASTIALTAGLALLAGIILLIAGLARFGFISDFLSRPVVTGFVFGIALMVIIGQVPKIFGVPGGEGTFFQQLAQLIANLGLTNPWTLAIGVGAIILILLLKRRYPVVPAALVALVAGILAVNLLNLTEYGVSVVGTIPAGFPAPGIPQVGLAEIPFLLAGAIGIVFIAIGESIGVARVYAARYHYEIDPDQELIALGSANIGCGLFQGATVDATLSSTATAEAAGGRTQVSGLLTAALIFLTVILIAPLFRNLPQAVLGAVVITAVIGLLNVAGLRRYYATHRTDFWLAVTALLGVIVIGILEGLVIAVVLSLIIVLYRASRPGLAVLGKVPGQDGTYGDIIRAPENESIPGLLILRLDAPLFFFNANVARKGILDLVSAGKDLRALILDIGATADLDLATVEMLRELVDTFRERKIELIFAHVRGPVRDRMGITGLRDHVGDGNIFPSTESAVQEYRRRFPGVETA